MSCLTKALNHGQINFNFFVNETIQLTNNKILQGKGNEANSKNLVILHFTFDLSRLIAFAQKVKLQKKTQNKMKDLFFVVSQRNGQLIMRQIAGNLKM